MSEGRRGRMSEGTGRLNRSVSAVVILAFMGFVIWVCVSVAIFHSENIALCNELGGSYNALGGQGQCVKDQVILFDPRHPFVTSTDKKEG